jgi:hypothetical protein
MWPGSYDDGKNAPNLKRLTFVVGRVKESRDQGKYSLSIDAIRQF